MTPRTGTAADGDQSGKTELVVIGGGPGGYAAAFHAADAGLEVALVDQDARLGGVCLNRGCIPSKALLHVARLIAEAREASRWGVAFGEPRIDLGRLRQWKDGIVTKLAGGVAELARRRRVDVIRARAEFLDSSHLGLRGPDGGESRLEFEHAILATGSSPALPPVFDVGDPRVMDSTGALSIAEVPKSLLVVGGGYIGLELGSVYAALGSRVTVVELTSGLLPGTDRDLVRPLAKRLAKALEYVFLETRVESLEPGPGGITARLTGHQAPLEMRFDRVLVSVGRRPNSGGLGLENTAVELTPGGFARVDDRQRTSDPRVLAIGDVAGEPMLAHKAGREAKVAVEHLVGEPAAFDNVAIPAVVFTDPEIAWCGVTEEQAEAGGREVEISRFPWAASGRALTLDRTEGLTKTIFDRQSGRLIGAGIVGPGAGELIAEATLAVEIAAVGRDIADTIHAHPTLSETFAESAEAFLGSATHLWRPKRVKG